MRKLLKFLAVAGVAAIAGGTALGVSAKPAEAGVRWHIGIGVPIFLPLPVYRPYYYHAPRYYHPPAYYAPPAPAYYAPPPCYPQYRWRWTAYGWQRIYAGCW